jgi:hypothetical protein
MLLPFVIRNRVLNLVALFHHELKASNTVPMRGISSFRAPRQEQYNRNSEGWIYLEGFKMYIAPLLSLVEGRLYREYP